MYKIIGDVYEVKYEDSDGTFHGLVKVVDTDNYKSDDIWCVAISTFTNSAHWRVCSWKQPLSIEKSHFVKHYTSEEHPDLYI